MNIDKKLDFYVKNNMNVMFIGRHGVGKTSIILDCFNRNDLKFLYFSASTMDPWVDFIGVPKERIDADGKSFIDLVRPKAIAADQVEAIFFDEFNRAPKKVRNATMELLQFKSINGHKLNNLKVIWTAINPDDVEEEAFQYDVEKLDPAQKDRFQIFLDIPYKLDKAYFSKKYTSPITEATNEWWERLNEKVRYNVSPRRVDYALDIFAKGGDIRDVLPAESNVSKLIAALKSAPLKEQMNKLMAANDTAGGATFINNDNNFFSCSAIIEENKKFQEFFIPLFEQERVVQAMIDSKVMKNFILDNKDRFKSSLEEISSAGSNKELAKEIDSVLHGTDVAKHSAPTFAIDGSKTPDRTSEIASLNATHIDVHNSPAWAKRSYIVELLKKFPARVSSKTADETLRICLSVLGTSNKGTIPEVEKFIKVINTLTTLIPSFNIYDFKAGASTEVLNGLNKIARTEEMSNVFIY